VKKIYYYLQFIPIIKNIFNWWDVIYLYFKPGKLITIRLRNGFKFNIMHHLDALTIKEIFIDNDYKVNKNKFKVIIDIGANIGTFSILAAKKYPQAKIYSYEPVKSTYNLLRQNIMLNKISNINTFRYGVSNEKRKTALYVGNASGLSSTTKRGKTFNIEIISMVTLKDIFDMNKINKCDLLKMDCEGGEYSILLKTDPKTLKRVNKYVVEYHDNLNGHNGKELLEVFRKLNYKVKINQHKIEPSIGIIYARR